MIHTMKEFGKKYKILDARYIKKSGDERAYRSTYPDGYWFNIPNDEIGERIKKDIYYYRRELRYFKRCGYS